MWVPKFQQFAVQSQNRFQFSQKVFKKLNNFKGKYKNQGITPVVLADFDYTFTNFLDPQNEMTPSSLGIIRHSGMLRPEFTDKLYDVYKKYSPVEKRLDITHEEKARVITEWNQAASDLFKSEQLPEDLILTALNASEIRFRYFLKEYLHFLNKYGVNTHIISAGPGQIINLMIEQLNLPKENQLKLDSNSYIIKNGCIDGIEFNIHSLEKYKAVRKYNYNYDNQTVMVFGDFDHDLSMASEFKNQDNVLSFLFLREQSDQDVEKYLENWDFIIQGDGNYILPFALTQKILGVQEEGYQNIINDQISFCNKKIRQLITSK